LVNIPIRLETCQKSHDIPLHNVCPTCHNRISYKKWCDHCNREIAYSEMKKGYYVSKSKGMVILDKETIQSLKAEKSNIDIVYFLPSDKIPFLFYEKVYNLIPQEETPTKAYNLLKELLRITNLVAIGKFTMRNKEHNIIIRYWLDRLFLCFMFYPNEINLSDIPKKDEIKREELEMGKKLIESLMRKSIQTLDRNFFKDRVYERVKNYIERGIVIPAEKHDVEKAKDLMETLKASVENSSKKKKKVKVSN